MKKKEKPKCRACGAPAVVLLIMDDGRDLPYCSAHVSDETAREILGEIQKEKE